MYEQQKNGEKHYEKNIRIYDNNNGVCGNNFYVLCCRCHRNRSVFTCWFCYNDRNCKLYACPILTNTIFGGKIMNILKKSKYEDMPHLEKDYYITEMHMGDIPGDGYELISTTDYAGPYKTLEKARKMFKKLVCKDKFLKSISLNFLSIILSINLLLYSYLLSSDIEF